MQVVCIRGFDRANRQWNESRSLDPIANRAYVQPEGTQKRIKDVKLLAPDAGR